MMTLDDMMNVYLIGATGGIGQLLTEELTKRGYYVVGIGRRENILKKLKERGITKEYIVADITRKEDRKRIIERLNSNSILIYNQGLIDPDRLENTEEDKIRKIFEINIISIMLMDREMILEQKLPKRIIYMASISSLLSWDGGSAYQASKTALLAYVSAMRIQDKATGRNLERIVIYPDTIKTGGMDRGLEQYPKIDGKVFVQEVVNIIDGKYKGMDFLFQIDIDNKVRLYRLCIDPFYKRPQALAKELIKELGEAVY